MASADEIFSIICSHYKGIFYFILHDSFFVKKAIISPFNLTGKNERVWHAFVGNWCLRSVKENRLNSGRFKGLPERRKTCCINYKSRKSTISRYYNCFKKPSSQLEALLGVFEIWNIQVKSWNDSGYLREINEI